MILTDHFRRNEKEIQDFLNDVIYKLATNDMSILYSLPIRLLTDLDQFCYSGMPLSYVIRQNYIKLKEQETERLNKLFDPEKNKEGYRDRIEETEDAVRSIAYELAAYETVKLNDIYPRSLYLKNPQTKMREIKEKYRDTYEHFYDAYYNKVAYLLGFDQLEEDGISKDIAA